MTPEAQRIAIAEYCGWQFIPDYCNGPGDPPEFTTITPDGRHLCGYYPDYLGSLDAMHEAEEFLKLEDPHVYACYAGDLCEKYGFEAVSLKPQIRAEEFLRTIGRWVE